MTVTETLTEDTATRFATAFAAIRQNMEQVVRGKPGLIDSALLCLVSGGHILVEDVPGLGKTLLAKALGASIDTKLGRIQFTPDLLPTDVTGVNIWNRGTNSFEFRPGPIFTELVLADEINRAAPKTQSALLEAMAEDQVTVDGTTYELPKPFMVVATQNPVEQEGTYPLPESQLDRFTLKVSVGYPSRTDEISILETHATDEAVNSLGSVATLADVKRMADMVPTVYVAPALQDYMVSLSEATRRHSAISLGVSPRATLALQKVARAKAASQGRTFVVDDDIKSVASAVFSHRIILTPEAQLQAATPEGTINQILGAVAVPAS